MSRRRSVERAASPSDNEDAQSEAHWTVGLGDTTDSTALRQPMSAQPSPNARQYAENAYRELAAEFNDSRLSGFSGAAEYSAKIAAEESSKLSSSSPAAKDKSSAVIQSLQAQLQVYIKKSDAGNRELQRLDAEIAGIKEQLAKEEASRGGFRAVQENARVVASAEQIMDKRVAKAMVRARLLQGIVVCSKYVLCRECWTRGQTYDVGDNWR